MLFTVRSFVLALIVLAVGATILGASDLPFIGNWKLNPAKSDFGGTTVTYEEVAGGQMRFTAEGQSYTFKTDGRDYPTPWGTAAAWKATGANAWEVTAKANAKVVSTASVQLAADGKTLTVDARNVRATGEVSSDTTVYERLSGGSGLVGKWKTKSLKIGAPGTMSITPSGPDGVTLTFVEEKGTCSARFDGKDHAATGPIWPSGWTCAVAKSGASALAVTWKKDGNVMYQDTLTPSADGKTLTSVSGAPATTEKVKAVYDRQ